MRPFLSQGGCQTGEGQAEDGIKFPKFQSMVGKEVPRFAINIVYNFRKVSTLSLHLSSISKTEIRYLFGYEAAEDRDDLTAGDRDDLATSTKKEFIAIGGYRNVSSVHY